MASKEQVQQELDDLNETIAAIYAEFVDEDRAMAEEGFAEYAQGLSKEDGA